MEAKELMIGDWVMIKDYPLKSMPLRMKPEYFIRSLVDFEPITLTEEILKLNGWGCHYDIRIMDEPEYYNDKVCFRLNRYYGGLFMEVGGCRFKEISYVHKLQQALRLCGMSELADNFIVGKNE